MTEQIVRSINAPTSNIMSLESSASFWDCVSYWITVELRQAPGKPLLN
jgi:hypothetical protein